jgi:uroporphyrinogen-III synthase
LKIKLCMLNAASKVLLTREAGKNAAVINMLEARGISYYELPMIETTDGPDKLKLESTLRTEKFDWIVLTSPEAASVFADSWQAAGTPVVRIAVVGKGTNLVPPPPHTHTSTAANSW